MNLIKVFIVIGNDKVIRYIMKILVIGDSCIDTFVYCHIDRICPEAPVPVLQPGYKSTNPGMAGNVAANLESLGAEVDLLTNSEMIEKTRYVDIKSGQMIMRLDDNDECEEYEGAFKTVGYDAIVISDYNKGFLNKDAIEAFVERAECPVFMDTKKILGDWCRNITFIKINRPEALLNKNYIYDNLIVTDGKNGAIYNDKVFPVKKEVNVSNVSGAGDTFLAALSYKYIEKGDIETAIDFANECASKVVQERGVTIV